MRRNLVFVLCVLVWPAVGQAFNEGLGEAPSEVERQSPAATVAGFLDATHARDVARMPHYLSLSHLPAEQQRAEGERLARRLMFVVDRTLWFDFARLEGEPRADAADARQVSLGPVPLGRGVKELRLRQVAGAGQPPVWVFSEGTVRAIDALFEAHGSPLLGRLPPLFFARPFWVLELWQVLGGVLLGGAAWLASRLLERGGLLVVGRAARLTRSGWDDQMLEAGRGPGRFLLLALLGSVGSRLLLLPPPAQRVMDLGARSLALASAGWFVLRLLQLASGLIERKMAAQTGADVARTRGVRTQLAVMRRILAAGTWVLTVSLLLLQFEAVRNVGMSLLASAGIAGLVLGLAAQKTISTLLGGIQLSLTQPVRIGDTVIVENEWGWIEEITLTYVVVKVWDLRRLVVPMSHFLDKPFQNWSKVSPELLGTVELYADYRADVGAVRAELARMLKDEGQVLWDGRAQGVQVTACSERTMTLRAMVSAADSGKMWDLRCLVREKLIAFLQRQPQGLPVLRAEAWLPPAEKVAAHPPLFPPSGGGAGENVVAARPR